jgi:hypothetical protein
MNRISLKLQLVEGLVTRGSHYIRGFVTTLHDFGGVLGRALDTFCWALTSSWSRLLGSCVKWPSC